MRKSKNKSAAMVKADKYFSRFIRLRDQDRLGFAECITCGTRTMQYDCGHFISRRFQSVRYDERNANAQCLKCNRFENGNQYEHGRAIDRKHGEGTAEELFLLSKQVTRRGHWDFEIIAEEYKQKIKEIG